MRTEIDEIKLNLRVYKSTLSLEDYITADSYLKSVHNKYGTVDINIIMDILR